MSKIGPIPKPGQYRKRQLKINKGYSTIQDAKIHHQNTKKARKARDKFDRQYKEYQDNKAVMEADMSRIKNKKPRLTEWEKKLIRGSKKS